MEVLIAWVVIFSIPIFLLMALAIWTWKYQKDHKEEREAEEAEREKRLEYILENATDEQLEVYINSITRPHRFQQKRYGLMHGPMHSMMRRTKPRRRKW